MAEGDEAFLSRWSRRKVALKQGEAVAPAPEPVLTPVRPVAAPVAVAREAAAPPTAAPLPQTEAPPPLPTLDDVGLLTRDSSFARFVGPEVDPGVRNAAMKKLFADPHFNVMDGLDTYIDDYNKFEPVPRSLLRQLVNARALGLLDDELEAQPTVDNAPAHHDPDPDLQLQPHDAAGRRSADEGPAEPSPAAEPAHDPVPPRGA
jgi:Protein of unknown function (DUF3306)